MAGLIGRFNTLFRRRQAEEEPRRTTSDELPGRPRSPVDLYSKFRAADDRKGLIEECRKMRREDSRASGVIATVARDAVRGGLQVQVADGPDAQRAQESADALFTRLKLNHRLDDWIRLTFDDGDSFLEHSVDEDGQIALVTRKPTLELHRASDRTDRFPDPTRAYWWGESWTGEPPKDAIWFARWQITHARWDHDEGSRYGRPLFASARTAYKRVREGELDVAVRRKTRAGLRFVHKLIGANWEQVEEYKRQNQDVLNDPFIALADFFINFEGGIEAIQGDANLDAIGDVLHHLRTWAISSPIPLPLLGYGENVNRDVLKEQQEQYHLALMEITSWAIGDLVEPMVKLQWLLDGIWPASLKYTIAQPTTEALSAETVKAAAEAAVKLKAAGLPAEFLWPVVARLIPTLDATAVLKALAAEQTLPPDDTERLAQEITKLTGVQSARIVELLGTWRSFGRAA